MESGDELSVTLCVGRDVGCTTAQLDLGLDELEDCVRVSESATRDNKGQQRRTSDGPRCSGAQLDPKQLDSVGEGDRRTQLAVRAGVAELDRIVTDAVEIHQASGDLGG